MPLEYCAHNNLVVILKTWVKLKEKRVGVGLGVGGTMTYFRANVDRRTLSVPFQLLMVQECQYCGSFPPPSFHVWI